MQYISIPITPDTFSAETVQAFAREFEAAHGKGGVLIHCGSSNRVGGLWAAYLHAVKGLSEDEAIEKGKAAGLRSESMISAARRVMADM